MEHMPIFPTHGQCALCLAPWGCHGHRQTTSHDWARCILCLVMSVPGTMRAQTQGLRASGLCRLEGVGKGETQRLRRFPKCLQRLDPVARRKRG